MDIVDYHTHVSQKPLLNLHSETECLSLNALEKKIRTLICTRIYFLILYLVLIKNTYFCKVKIHLYIVNRKMFYLSEVNYLYTTNEWVTIICDNERYLILLCCFIIYINCLLLTWLIDFLNVLRQSRRLRLNSLSCLFITIYKNEHINHVNKSKYGINVWLQSPFPQRQWRKLLLIAGTFNKLNSDFVTLRDHVTSNI